LGAEVIVSGVISQIGDLYRLRVRALNVESAEIQGQFNRNNPAGPTITALVNSRAAGHAAGSGLTAYGGGSAGSTSAAPLPRSPTGAQAAQARPANGTYTFWPRPQAYQGASKVNAYINKILVRGEYMSIYFTGTASGPGKDSRPQPDWVEIYTNQSKIILQDLDNPSKSYTRESIPRLGFGYDDDGYYYSFKGVTARRFSLTNGYTTVPSVFEEIILGEPDAQ
jgi:hypothetical protein